MALTDSNDPNNDFINAMTYLGKGPFNIGMPGGGGDISTGAGPAPAPGVNVGLFGRGVGGATGGGGGEGGGADILGLIQKSLGAGGKSADFLKKLTAGDPQGMDVLRSMVSSGELDLGAFGGLEGLGTELPNTTMQAPGEFSDLSKFFSGSLASPNLDASSLEGLTTSGSLSGIEGGAGGAGALSTGASGAGALAAILGILADQSGNKDLATAAKATGAAGDVAGLAGSGAALAGSLGTEAGVEAGAEIGLGAGAGLAFSPITAMMLASMISGLAGGEDPVGEGIGEMMAGSPHYQSFVPRKLMPAETQQRTGFDTLEKALPYVKSQEELGELLNTYKNYVGTTTGIDMGPSDIYGLSAIPGTGPVTHGEQTPSIDWSGRQNSLQSLIDAMKGVLPGSAITDPNERVSGEGARRLWDQFLSPAAGAGPNQMGGDPLREMSSYSNDMFNMFAGEGSPYSQVKGSDLQNALGSGVIRTPTWDPATGEFVYSWSNAPGPEKGSDFFKKAPYMDQLQAMLSGGGAGKPGGALSPETVDAMSSSGGGPDVWLDWLKRQQVA